MVLINILLTDAGYSPISHGVLDYFAMRVSPKNYATIFEDYVNQKNKISQAEDLPDEEYTELTHPSNLKRYQVKTSFMSDLFNLKRDYRIELRDEERLVGHMDIRNHMLHNPFALLGASTIDIYHKVDLFLLRYLIRQFKDISLRRLKNDYILIDLNFVYNSIYTDEFLRAGFVPLGGNEAFLIYRSTFGTEGDEHIPVAA